MSSRAAVELAARSIIYLDLDVHKESITIAVLPEGARTPSRLDRLPNGLPKLKRWLERWLERVARDGELRACYEASGAGYVLHRALAEWGYACEVIAPSLIPKRSGVQRKHDKRDAADLARLYRAGELTADGYSPPMLPRVLYSSPVRSNRARYSSTGSADPSG